MFRKEDHAVLARHNVDHRTARELNKHHYVGHQNIAWNGVLELIKTVRAEMFCQVPMTV